MTITYNTTTEYIEVTDSTVLSDYDSDNTLSITVKLSINCADESDQTISWDASDTSGNYYQTNTLYIKKESLTTSVYSVRLSYSSEGVTKIDKQCNFYDKDNELKCKTLESLDIDNVLLYEYLSNSALCSECDCGKLCEALKILNKNLENNDSDNKCKQCD